MSKAALKRLMGVIAASSLSLSAGETVLTAPLASALETAESENWSFCDALVSLGKPVYQSQVNPFIQNFRVRGRMHYQWGHVDGTSDGIDFEGSGGELRRLWGGVKFTAFQNLDVLATGRFSRQGFRNNQIEWREVDFLSFDYRLNDFGPFTNTKLGYGRYRMDFGREWHISVNKIKTPERAPIFDRFIEPRATSVRFRGDLGPVNFMLDYMSTDRSDWLARWNGGQAFHFATKWKALGGQWFADGYFVDASAAQDELLNYDKAFSLAYEWEVADWTMFVNGVWGDLGSEELWGVVTMAHRMIYQNKIEAVFRYQYSSATADEIRIGGRAARGVAASQADIGARRGDTEQNAYVGLNFYGCGFGAKANSMLLLGVEWDKVTGSNQDFEAFTFWTNYRIYF